MRGDEVWRAETDLVALQHLGLLQCLHSIDFSCISLLHKPYLTKGEKGIVESTAKQITCNGTHLSKRTLADYLYGPKVIQFYFGPLQSQVLGLQPGVLPGLPFVQFIWSARQLALEFQSAAERPFQDEN